MSWITDRENLILKHDRRKRCSSHWEASKVERIGSYPRYYVVVNVASTGTSIVRERLRNLNKFIEVTSDGETIVLLEIDRTTLSVSIHARESKLSNADPITTMQQPEIDVYEKVRRLAFTDRDTCSPRWDKRIQTPASYQETSELAPPVAIKLKLVWLRRPKEKGKQERCVPRYALSHLTCKS